MAKVALHLLSARPSIDVLPLLPDCCSKRHEHKPPGQLLICKPPGRYKSFKCLQGCLSTTGSLCIAQEIVHIHSDYNVGPLDVDAQQLLRVWHLKIAVTEPSSVAAHMVSSLRISPSIPFSGWLPPLPIEARTRSCRQHRATLREQEGTFLGLEEM